MAVAEVLDSTMFYRETGAGGSMVFLHGNPTSSHLWRRVMPHLAAQWRCLAPDMIGMGRSGKPLIAYRFADHARYLDAWIDTLDLQDVVFVGHDWGGALAFDWAARHPGRSRGVVFLETIVRPMSWAEFPDSAQAVFASLRTREVGEEMVLHENVFIEQALPGTVASLTDEDLDHYRAPYPTPQSRLPLLQWPREMPLDGEPGDVVARVEAYDEWLAHSLDVPKLLLTFDPGPGLMIGPEMVAWCQANIANLDVVPCGRAGHHAPEDQPDAIATAIASWTDRHRLVTAAAQQRRARS